MAPDLHGILAAAGQELAALGRVMQGLQDTLTSGHAGSADLQALDSVTQHLFALGRLLGTLAPGGDGRTEAALDGVSLGGLQRRLRGQAAYSPDSGEVELFGHD